jgi:protein-L-isoaspartate(D-aspartate) O-methyltransferase
MVEDQIKSRGVKDSLVLRAMEKVPRHLFVPENMVKWSYGDEPLPIGEDQTISQPYIVALMTELLELSGGEKVLEVGTGSGYQAAVLSCIADSVFSIEIVEPLAERAKEVLNSLRYDNVYVKTGDAYFGWPDHAPFDCVIITAAAPKIPPLLIEQLIEGGRMVLPLGRGNQDLLVVEKRGGKLVKRSVIPVRFVPMTGRIQRN